MGTNRSSLAVVDSRITTQSWSVASLGLDSAVDGSAATINVGPSTNTSSIVRSIDQALRDIEGEVKLDIIAHGTAGILDGSTAHIFRVQLGEPGIYNHPASLTPWRELSGRISKVRFMSCGVRSSTISRNFGDPASFDSQNQLMLAFARTINRTVKYTYETYLYDVDLHANVTPNRPGVNVFEVEPNGTRRTLR